MDVWPLEVLPEEGNLCPLSLRPSEAIYEWVVNEYNTELNSNNCRLKASESISNTDPYFGACLHALQTKTQLSVAASFLRKKWTIRILKKT